MNLKTAIQHALLGAQRVDNTRYIICTEYHGDLSMCRHKDGFMVTDGIYPTVPSYTRVMTVSPDGTLNHGLTYSQALRHYRQTCFYRAADDDLGLDLLPARWEVKAKDLARRYMRLWYGLA